MAEKHAIEAPTTLAIDEVDEATVLSVRHGAATLDADQRAEVLRRLRAGEPVTVNVEARVFKQTAKPNRKFVRFLDNDLEKFAASFKGKPFLRDHEQGSLEARGGTITESALHGSSEIRQTITLVKPWAVEAALDGTLDRFSIGWFSPKPVKCSACGKPMFDYRAGCTHMPGDEVEVDGVKQTVEMLFEKPEGTETSAVNVPAVNGTGIDQIRAALSAARGTHNAPMGGRKKPSMDPKILESLGLAADASEADAIVAVTKLRAEIESHKVALAGTSTRLADAEAKLSTLAADAKKRDVDALVEQARAEKKVVLSHDAEGKLVEGQQERAIRLLAAQDIEAARAWVAGLPALIPAGPAQSAGADPTPDKPEVGKLTTEREARARRHAAELGVDPEKYIANLIAAADAKRAGRKE